MLSQIILAKVDPKLWPYAVYKYFFGFRNIKSANVRRCAHVLVFTTSRSNESLKNQLQFAGLPKSHADGFHEEDALEDSTITQHCCQEFLVTPSRRSSQHHVGCKLLAAENPHSVRYRTARTRVLGLRRRKLVVRQRVACDHSTS